MSVRTLVSRGGFRDLLAGQTVSSLGDWMATVAFMALTLELTDSPTAVGNPLHPPDGVDDLGMPDDLKQSDVAGAVAIGITGLQIDTPLPRQRLDHGRGAAVADDAVTFMADEQRVRQVLYNLISNAIGFSNAGDTVVISAWREADMMAFAVEDQGVGRQRFGLLERAGIGARHVEHTAARPDLHAGSPGCCRQTRQM